MFIKPLTCEKRAVSKEILARRLCARTRLREDGLVDTSDDDDRAGANAVTVGTVEGSSVSTGGRARRGGGERERTRQPRRSWAASAR